MRKETTETAVGKQSMEIAMPSGALARRATAMKPHIQRLMLVAAALLAFGCASPADRGSGARNPAPDADADVLLARAYDHIRNNDLAAAEQDLEQARRAAPDNPWVALNLGVVYQRTGRIELAREQYEYSAVARGASSSSAAAATAPSARAATVAEIARRNLDRLPHAVDRAAAPAAATALAASAPVAAATPAVAPAPAPAVTQAAADEDAAGSDAGILSFIAAWRDAWESRDLLTYLASYDAAYQGRETSPQAWQAARRRIIGKADAIRIEIADLGIAIQDRDRAVVTFRQTYRASNRSDVGAKKLRLRRIGGHWRIVAEIFTSGNS